MLYLDHTKGAHRTPRRSESRSDYMKEMCWMFLQITAYEITGDGAEHESALYEFRPEVIEPMVTVQSFERDLRIREVPEELLERLSEESILELHEIDPRRFYEIYWRYRVSKSRELCGDLLDGRIDEVSCVIDDQCFTVRPVVRR